MKLICNDAELSIACQFAFLFERRSLNSKTRQIPPKSRTRTDELAFLKDSLRLFVAIVRIAATNRSLLTISYWLIRPQCPASNNHQRKFGSGFRGCRSM